MSEHKVDLTETIKPEDPFTALVRQVIDREFPLIEKKLGGAILIRRGYGVIWELYDMDARLRSVQVGDEMRILGEEAASFRCFSITETAVGLTLLAGRECKQGGRPRQMMRGVVVPGEARLR